MQVKKNKRIDVLRRNSYFLQIGIAVSLGIVLLAFEWKTYDRSFKTLYDPIGVEFEQEMIPITMVKEKLPPPPPPAKVPDVSEIQEAEIISSEINQETKIDYQLPPKEIIDEEDIVLQYSQIMPTFVGGERELFKYLNSHIEYSRSARRLGLSGTVFISMIVNRDGTIHHAKVEKGLHPEIDSSAIQAVRNMPPWNPGKQNGISRKVRVILPIKFNLQ